MSRTLMVKRLLNALCVGLFLVVIFAPAVIMLGRPDRAQSDIEKRELASWETVTTTSTLARFIDTFEQYVTDQFGLRETFVYWNAYLKVAVLRTSPVESVVIGEDGWLFFTENDRVGDFRGLNDYTFLQQGRWQTYERRRQWLAGRGIAYAVVIAPDKKSIYPEKFPAQYTVIQPGNTLLDLFVAYMRDHTETPVIDLRGPLLAVKDGLPDGTNLYLKYDTHWTDHGEYVTYRAMIEQLGHVYPQFDFPLLPAEAITWQPDERVGGDLATFIGLPEAFRETVQAAHYPPGLPCGQAVDYSGPLASPEVIVERHCPDNDVNAIVLHDSFFLRMRPLVGHSFGRSLFIPRGAMPVQQEEWEAQMEALLAYSEADIVIEQLVERTLPEPE